MATAKTIEQLDAAAQINAGDKLPFAQAAGVEAKAGTVAQLAETVADINEDGALSELAYATSQGKNAVAAALTAKGVPTAASETLIQMADKVNNLNVDTAAEFWTGKLLTGVAGTGDNQGRWLKYLPVKKAWLVWYGTYLYYVPDGTEFDSLADMISKAAFSFNTTVAASSSNGILGFSPNNEYVIIKEAQYVVRKYQITSTAFVQGAQFTLPTNHTPDVFAVDNTGKYSVFYSDHVYFLDWSAAELSAVQQSGINCGSYGGSDIYLFDGVMYSVYQSSSGGGAVYVRKYTWSVNAETGFVCEQLWSQTMDESRFNGSNSWTLKLADDGQTLFVLARKDGTSYQTLGSLYKYPLYVACADTPLQSQQFDVIAFMQTADYVTGGSQGDRYYWVYPPNFYVIKNDTGKFELHNALLQEQYFEYDITENTIQAVNARTPGGVVCPVDYIYSGSYYWTAIKAGENTVLRLANYGNSAANYTYLLTYSADDKILCQKRTVNGKELYMFDVSRVSPADVADGWLDVTTQITPAVPDSASNAQADSASGAEEGSAAAGATPQAQDAGADAEGADA